MIRLSFCILLLVLGFLLPSWIFLLALFGGALLFRLFWEAILIMIIMNVVYMYNGASFQALYVLWGVGAFIISYFVHTRTRFQSDVSQNNFRK